MNTSGEAADQVVRMALQTGEVALKIYRGRSKAACRFDLCHFERSEKNKRQSAAGDTGPHRETIDCILCERERHKEFVKEAKRYGVLYCAVRNPRGSKDGKVDLIVKEEDASRINRIVERFKFASVSEVAKIKSEIVRSREEKGAEAPDHKRAGQPEPEKGIPEKSDADKLVDELRERLCIKREKKRRTLFRQRQRNPVCPSLHPAGTAKPKRVLLSQQIQKMEGNLLYDRS